jgi:hypothetical protein
MPHCTGRAHPWCMSQLMVFPSLGSNGLEGGTCKSRRINQVVKRLTPTGGPGSRRNEIPQFRQQPGVQTILFPVPCL